jgi:hypothetical protein
MFGSFTRFLGWNIGYIEKDECLDEGGEGG